MMECSSSPRSEVERERAAAGCRAEQAEGDDGAHRVVEGGLAHYGLRDAVADPDPLRDEAAIVPIARMSVQESRVCLAISIEEDTTSPAPSARR
jgi:hypothetical protein